MPNLYKQYFVHNEPDKTRVINSNDIVEKRLEKMAELKRMEQKTTDGNGFSAGIVGPDTDYVEEIDHTAEAKKEAEKILAEAHAQAETILSQADQEAENIRENAKNTGYQEGRQCLESELAAQRFPEFFIQLKSGLFCLNRPSLGKHGLENMSLPDVLFDLFDFFAILF